MSIQLELKVKLKVKLAIFLLISSVDLVSAGPIFANESLIPGTTGGAASELEVEPTVKLFQNNLAPVIQNGKVVMFEASHNQDPYNDSSYWIEDLKTRGYTVLVNTEPLSLQAIEIADVLIVSVLRHNFSISSSYTDSEAQIIKQYVSKGGGLMLLADHSGYSLYAQEIASAFGITLDGETILEQPFFSSANFDVEHPIMAGINLIGYNWYTTITPGPASPLIWENDGGTVAVTFSEGSGRGAVFGDSNWPLSIFNNYYWADNSLLALQAVDWLAGQTGREEEPPPPAILFLPGIMGSRLYEGENRRWEPGSENDVQRLYLDENGESLNNITVGNVIDTFDGPLLFNLKIYESFLQELEQKKSEGTIRDYSVISYDWRFSLPDILENGEIENELRRLAADSDMGKVAIVAHSNGGLIAKALVNKLGNDATDLISQIIFVGVPQIGIPQSVGAILHGYNLGMPFRFSAARARDFAKNAPFVYHLLPHPDYYDNTGSTIETNIIKFTPGESTQLFIDAYGEDIDTTEELYSFILGQEGRTAPEYSDLKNPAIGNNTLLSQTLSYLGNIGSTWQPPAGITVHQIAGIGEDTLAGITYKTVQECVFRIRIFGSVVPLCLKYESQLSYTPNEVVDGDGTVVVPSALVMSDSAENIKRWWVNLQQYNKTIIKSLPGLGVLRTDHGDILEVDELRSFIFEDIIASTTDVLPNYLSTTQPQLTGNNRLRFILHSPLALSVFDSEGNEISESVSNISGASYRRYGEVQVVTAPTEVLPKLQLTGIQDGTFTLEIEEYDNSLLVATTTFSGILSSASTTVTMNFPDGTIENVGNLEIDYNGDKKIDLTLLPEEGVEITMPEPSTADLLAALKEYIHALNIEEQFKRVLLQFVESIEKHIERQEKLLERFLSQIENLQGKPYSEKVIDALERQIKKLEENKKEVFAALIEATKVFAEYAEQPELQIRDFTVLVKALTQVLKDLY